MSYYTIIVLVLCLGSAMSQSVCETERLKKTKVGGGWTGTNLGSWFILEQWMASYLWRETKCSTDKDQGSYLFEKCVGSAKAKELMEKHWSTWITEADFEIMSKNGINVVRIPVGWWHIYDPEGGAAKAKLNYKLPDTAYVSGGLAYLDKAFEWGEKHGVGIIVDLHAAPGSQNGNDNSSPYEFHARHFFTNPDNPKQAIDSMELYAQRYAAKPALVGFELINEPGVWSAANWTEINILQDYYQKAYTAIRKHSNHSWIFIMPYNVHNGREDTWTKFMNKADGYTNVALDLHTYSCLGGPADKSDIDQTIAYINNEYKNSIAEYNKVNSKPQMIGEWSACHHGDSAKSRDFFRAQLNVFNTTRLGQTFWSWADSGVGVEWSMKAAIREGWLGKLPSAC